MVVFSIRITVESAERPTLLATLGPLVEPTRVAPGCLGCLLYVDVEDANAFCLVSEWSQQADLDRYLRSNAYGVLLGAIEIGKCHPEVRLDVVRKRASMDALGAARGI